MNAFLVLYSNFNITNFVFWNQFSNKADISKVIFWVVRNHEKLFMAQNLDISVQGWIFITEEPLNIDVRNVKADLTDLAGGWIMEILCNYVGAPLVGGNVYFDNHTTYTTPLRKYINQGYQPHRTCKPNYCQLFL